MHNKQKIHVLYLNGINFCELENFAIREDLFSRMNCFKFFARIYFRESAMLRIFVNTNFHESAILRYFTNLRIDYFQFFADTYFRESDFFKLFERT